MKRRLFYLALSFIMLFSISLTLSSCSEANTIDLENKSEEEIIGDKTAEEIVEDIKNSNLSLESSVSMLYATQLNEKFDELDPDILIDEIKNSKNSDIARIIFIQVCDSHSVNLTVDKDILSILEDSNEPLEVRINLLFNYSQYSDDLSLLQTFAEGDDDELTFQALKILNIKDPVSANIIADTALANYKSISEDTLNICLSVKSSYFKRMNPNISTGEKVNVEELEQFIEICDYLITSIPADKESNVRASAEFAISEALHERTITYLINSQLIDNAMKVYAIDQNMIVLIDMIEKNPTEENVDTVIKAMEIYPLKNLEEPLKEYVNNNTYKSEEINNIIDKIEIEGEFATLGEKILD